MHRCLFFVFLLLFVGITESGRNAYRQQDSSMPHIITQWDNEAQTYALKDSHLEAYPIFKVFDKEFFMNNLLPAGNISYRYKADSSVNGAHLSSLIEHLLKEIDKKKKRYKNFTILSNKNFNRKKACGMLVLRFNDYPFIVKLCIETPATFVDPYCKGLDNVWFFPMGGGVNRHITGLTRIKNAQIIQERIAQSPVWAHKVDIPRKWYWLPTTRPWIKITGKHIGGLDEITTTIPGTYCVIADAIESDKQLRLLDSKDTTMAMDLCNYLQLFIDPHINNFMIENASNKIVIVDTEHFPTVVGIKNAITFNNYTEWYLYLISKCAKDWFFRTKEERIAAQLTPNKLALI